MHLLLGLAMWRTTSSIVLHGRGDLPALILLGELVCTSSRCLHMLWESWSPLEWFWGYWGRSRQWHTPICCKHIIRLVLDILAEFQGNRSWQRGCMVVGIGGWVEGEVGACMSLRCRSGSPLLHCIWILALSRCWMYIRMCCHTCGASTSAVIDIGLVCWHGMMSWHHQHMNNWVTLTQ